MGFSFPLICFIIASAAGSGPDYSQDVASHPLPLGSQGKPLNRFTDEFTNWVKTAPQASQDEVALYLSWIDGIIKRSELGGWVACRKTLEAYRELLVHLAEIPLFKSMIWIHLRLDFYSPGKPHKSLEHFVLATLVDSPGNFRYTNIIFTPSLPSENMPTLLKMAYLIVIHELSHVMVDAVDPPDVYLFDNGMTGSSLEEYIPADWDPDVWRSNRMGTPDVLAWAIVSHSLFKYPFYLEFLGYNDPDREFFFETVGMPLFTLSGMLRSGISANEYLLRLQTIQKFQSAVVRDEYYRGASSFLYGIGQPYPTAPESGRCDPTFGDITFSYEDPVQKKRIEAEIAILEVLTSSGVPFEEAHKAIVTQFNKATISQICTHFINFYLPFLMYPPTTSEGIGSGSSSSDSSFYARLLRRFINQLDYIKHKYDPSSDSSLVTQLKGFDTKLVCDCDNYCPCNCTQMTEFPFAERMAWSFVQNFKRKHFKKIRIRRILAGRISLAAKTSGFFNGPLQEQILAQMRRENLIFPPTGGDRGTVLAEWLRKHVPYGSFLQLVNVLLDETKGPWLLSILTYSSITDFYMNLKSGMMSTSPTTLVLFEVLSSHMVPSGLNFNDFAYRLLAEAYMQGITDIDLAPEDALSDLLLNVPGRRIATVNSFVELMLDPVDGAQICRFFNTGSIYGFLANLSGYPSAIIQKLIGILNLGPSVTPELLRSQIQQLLRVRNGNHIPTGRPRCIGDGEPTSSLLSPSTPMEPPPPVTPSVSSMEALGAIPRRRIRPRSSSSSSSARRKNRAKRRCSGGGRSEDDNQQCPTEDNFFPIQDGTEVLFWGCNGEGYEFLDESESSDNMQNVGSVSECRGICKAHSGCQCYTFNGLLGQCLLGRHPYSDQARQDYSHLNPHTSSGSPRACNQEGVESNLRHLREEEENAMSEEIYLLSGTNSEVASENTAGGSTESPILAVSLTTVPPTRISPSTHPNAIPELPSPSESELPQPPDSFRGALLLLLLIQSLWDQGTSEHPRRLTSARDDNMFSLKGSNNKTCVLKGHAFSKDAGAEGTSSPDWIVTGLQFPDACHYECYSRGECFFFEYSRYYSDIESIGWISLCRLYRETAIIKGLVETPNSWIGLKSCFEKKEPIVLKINLERFLAHFGEPNDQNFSRKLSEFFHDLGSDTDGWVNKLQEFLKRNFSLTTKNFKRFGRLLRRFVIGEYEPRFAMDFTKARSTNAKRRRWNYPELTADVRQAESCAIIMAEHDARMKAWEREDNVRDLQGLWKRPLRLSDRTVMRLAACEIVKRCVEISNENNQECKEIIDWKTFSWKDYFLESHSRSDSRVTQCGDCIAREKELDTLRNNPELWNLDTEHQHQQPRSNFLSIDSVSDVVQVDRQNGGVSASMKNYMIDMILQNKSMCKRATGKLWREYGELHGLVRHDVTNLVKGRTRWADSIGRTQLVGVKIITDLRFQPLIAVPRLKIQKYLVPDNEDIGASKPPLIEFPPGSEIQIGYWYWEGPLDLGTMQTATKSSTNLTGQYKYLPALGLWARLDPARKKRERCYHLREEYVPKSSVTHQKKIKTKTPWRCQVLCENMKRKDGSCVVFTWDMIKHICTPYTSLSDFPDNDPFLSLVKNDNLVSGDLTCDKELEKAQIARDLYLASIDKKDFAGVIAHYATADATLIVNGSKLKGEKIRDYWTMLLVGVDTNFSTKAFGESTWERTTDGYRVYSSLTYSLNKKEIKTSIASEWIPEGGTYKLQLDELAGCWVLDFMFEGADLTGIVNPILNVASVKRCIELCSSNVDCTWWSWKGYKELCYLKSANNGVKSVIGALSGPRNCAF